MSRSGARLLVTGAVAVAVGAAIALSAARTRPPEAPLARIDGGVEVSRPRGHEPPPPPAPVAPARAPASNPSPAAQVAPASPRIEAAPRPDGGAPVAVVRLRGDQPLASVNGVPLTLEQLMPVGPDARGAEHTLPLERYTFLLERAVDRELTFQEAGAQGVGLDGGQFKSLAQLRARAEASEPGAFDSLSRTSANTEFEQREVAALMLQSNLAIRAGSPGPHVTSDMVERHYREHRAEFGELPQDPAARESAWRRIDASIRERLASSVEAEHARRVRETLDEVRARADVRLGRPPA